MPGSRRKASAILVKGPVAKMATGSGELLTVSIIKSTASSVSTSGTDSGKETIGDQKVSEASRIKSGNSLSPSKGVDRPTPTRTSKSPRRSSIRSKLSSKISGRAMPLEIVIASTSNSGFASI